MLFLRYILIGYVVFFVRPAFSEAVFFSNPGPGGGGWIESLAIDPTNPEKVFLSCDIGGFYASEKAGQEWSIQNKGLGDYFIESIAIHPVTHSIILLATQTGVYKSINRGKTWKLKRRGFPKMRTYSFSAPVSVVKFHPVTPNIVLAGIGRFRKNKAGEGKIYISHDTGETWTLLQNKGGLPSDAVINDIEIARDGSYIFLITDKGVYRSDDSSLTWQESNRGLPHKWGIKATIHSNSTNIIYITMKNTASLSSNFNGGVFRSDDSGHTWRRVSEGLPGNISRTKMPGNRNQSFYQEILVHPKNPDIAYVGNGTWLGDAGVYKTMDGGKNWELITHMSGLKKNMEYGWNIKKPSVTSMAISESNPEQILFGTQGHVFFSSNGGLSWEQRYTNIISKNKFRGNGLETTVVSTINFSPVDDDLLYIGYLDIGLFSYSESSNLFSLLTKGFLEGNILDIVIDPDKPSTIWAARGNKWSKYGDVYMSIDSGESWDVVGSPRNGLPRSPVTRIVLDPNSPADNRVLYVISKGNGIYKSSNNGSSWYPVNQGLPDKARSFVVDLEVNPKNTQQIRSLLGTNPDEGSGLYETQNGARYWQHISSESAPFAKVNDLAVRPDDWNVVYISQRKSRERNKHYAGGVYKSIDGGRSWKIVLKNHFPRSLAISPLDNNVIYLGTTDHPYRDEFSTLGLLQSSDGGMTWGIMDTNLSSLKINKLAINPRDHSTIVVGTSGNGLFISKKSLASN